MVKTKTNLAVSLMVSKEAEAFLTKKISKNILEGRPRSQAVAISFSQARKKGFRF